LQPWQSNSRKSALRICRNAPTNCGGFFDVPKLETQVAALEERMSAGDFWNNRERAQADVEEISRVKSLLNPFRELEREIADFDALQQLTEEETNATARA